MPPAGIKDRLLKLLAHPNIASKHWIIRQYDHEVQGGSVIKPLVGPEQIGPSDAAVLRPKLDREVLSLVPLHYVRTDLALGKFADAVFYLLLFFV